jgi:hypothetical protein
MTLDIRYPIGLLFSLIGAMLLAEGVFGGAAPAAAADGLNVDLWWGLVMLVFGGSMLFFARRHAWRSGGAG